MQDDESQGAPEEAEQESESLIGDDDDLFGEGATDDVEVLDKNGRYADEDEDEDEEEEDEEGVDFDEM
jgi:hypothetical protein